jgi:hypothetical protein
MIGRSVIGSALVVSALPVSRGWQVIPALWTCGETGR